MFRHVTIRYSQGIEKYIISLYEGTKMNSLEFSKIPDWIHEWLKTGNVPIWTEANEEQAEGRFNRNK
jgi:hypothetical protein